MPAPQASMMKQLARLKFSGNGLKVPDQWSGPPDQGMYNNSFKADEKGTSPDPTAPPLFLPHSLNKYHTDTQKRLTKDIGGYMDGVIDAICSAWGQWQTAASMVGVIINAVTASVGQVIGPPLTPLILASAPKNTPQLMKYSNAIAQVIGTGWLAYTASIKIPGLPWYPAFAASPTPVAVPTPNIPMPVIALTQVTAPVSAQVMKGLMISQLADPMAMYHRELFDAITDAFEKCFQMWQTTTMVTNVIGTGPVPSWTPVSPAGPVVAGVGTMPPGGFT